MRDSIEYAVSGNEGTVGSNSDVALYQELGTSHIPPHSFLVSSAISSEERILKMAGNAVVHVLEDRGLHASELAHLWHALREAGHALKEDFEELVEDNDGGSIDDQSRAW